MGSRNFRSRGRRRSRRGTAESYQSLLCLSSLASLQKLTLDTEDNFEEVESLVDLVFPFSLRTLSFGHFQPNDPNTMIDELFGNTSYSWPGPPPTTYFLHTLFKSCEKSLITLDLRGFHHKISFRFFVPVLPFVAPSPSSPPPSVTSPSASNPSRQPPSPSSPNVATSKASLSTLGGSPLRTPSASRTSAKLSPARRRRQRLGSRTSVSSSAWQTIPTPGCLTSSRCSSGSISSRGSTYRSSGKSRRESKGLLADQACSRRGRRGGSWWGTGRRRFEGVIRRILAWVACPTKARRFSTILGKWKFTRKIGTCLICNFRVDGGFVAFRPRFRAWQPPILSGLQASRAKSSCGQLVRLGRMFNMQRVTIHQR